MHHPRLAVSVRRQCLIDLFHFDVDRIDHGRAFGIAGENLRLQFVQIGLGALASFILGRWTAAVVDVLVGVRMQMRLHLVHVSAMVHVRLDHIVMMMIVLEFDVMLADDVARRQAVVHFRRLNGTVRWRRDHCRNLQVRLVHQVRVSDIFARRIDEIRGIADGHR